MLDSVDTKQLNTHARVIAEALACSIYPKLAEAGCSAQLFSGSLAPTPESLAGWLDLVTSAPRHHHPRPAVEGDGGACVVGPGPAQPRHAVPLAGGQHQLGHTPPPAPAPPPYHHHLQHTWSG